MLYKGNERGNTHKPSGAQGVESTEEGWSCCVVPRFGACRWHTLFLNVHSRHAASHRIYIATTVQREPLHDAALGVVREAHSLIHDTRPLPILRCTLQPLFFCLCATGQCGLCGAEWKAHHSHCGGIFMRYGWVGVGERDEGVW